MPGDNCSVVGCGTCRRTKGIGIWKLRAARNEEYRKWRKDWLNELTKYRVADKEFQRQIENYKVFTCEKHFHESDIETCKFQQFTIHRVYVFVNQTFQSDHVHDETWDFNVNCFLNNKY